MQGVREALAVTSDATTRSLPPPKPAYAACSRCLARGQPRSRGQAITSGIMPAGPCELFLSNQATQHGAGEMPSAARGRPRCAWEKAAPRPVPTSAPTTAAMPGGTRAVARVGLGGTQSMGGTQNCHGCPGRASDSTFLQWYRWLLSLFSLPGAPGMSAVDTPPKQLNVAPGLCPSPSHGSAWPRTGRDPGDCPTDHGSSAGWLSSREPTRETRRVVPPAPCFGGPAAHGKATSPLPPSAVTPKDLPTSLAWHQGTLVVMSLKHTGTYPRPLQAQDPQNKSHYFLTVEEVQWGCSGCNVNSLQSE